MKLALALCALALVWSASAAGSARPLAAPAGLHGFEYRADDPVPADHGFTQLPAFAWAPVAGASHYEIQLATSVTFQESTMLVDDQRVLTPVTSLQLQVPWMTGHPYALWARVRAAGHGRLSAWGAPFGFNTSWKQVPQQLSAPRGLVRWTPIAGATGYEVWFQDIRVRVRTMTNVADEREYWTLHPDLAGTIHWRVRALRFVKDAELPNKIQVVTYGPYSRTFTSTNQTTFAAAPLQGTDAVSDVDTHPSVAQPNALMPGFAWTGTTGTGGVAGDGLWRVYIFSDQGCVNPVTVGSLVGGPAWAPRWAPPMSLPTTSKELTALAQGQADFTFGPQSNAQMADYTTIATAEEAGATTSAGAGTTPTAPAASDPSLTTSPGSVLLPDNGWPAGRYWWTIVPVGIFVKTTAAASGSAPAAQTLYYRDLELPQDACAAGRVWSFGMQSMAVTTNQAAPLASGLQGSRVVSAAARQPAFVQLPVVTWEPALGAQSYELQLSRRPYPWKTVIKQVSVVPSATLNLTKDNVGLWYYRVRGINANLPGTAIKMTWSKPTAIRISGDVFTVVK
jgi:hypothetical protein